MNKSTTKFLGALFIIFGTSGIVLCILGSFLVWQAQDELRMAGQDYLEIAGSTLASSQQSLSLAEEALDAANASLALLNNTTGTTSETIDNLIPVLSTFSSLMINDLPDTIEATRTSLTAAQTSAKLVDDFLAGLARIPFINLDAYNPDLPLNQALGDIAENLEGLPASFSVIDSNLQATNANLAAIQTDLEGTQANILVIQENLDASQQVLSDFQQDLTRLEASLAELGSSIETGLQTLAQVATLVLVWLAVTQLGLVVQGLAQLKK